ncbi:hypothetical protein Hanom_Chr17g01531711 [Helianthus anomalus]
MWDEVNKDEEVKGMLNKIKHKLAAYFPVLIDEAPRIIDPTCSSLSKTHTNCMFLAYSNNKKEEHEDFHN